MKKIHISRRFKEVVLLTIIYSVITNVLLLILARIYAGAPSTFSPFMYWPVISLTTAGVIVAAFVYVFIGLFTKNQNKIFLSVATVALFLSFIPDLMLFHPVDPEDFGATPAIIAILMLMHVLTAWIVVYMFTEK